MPKTKKQKESITTLLAENIKKAKAAVFANFQGLTVADFEQLRHNCRQENVGVVAIKKTLAKRALTDAGLADVDTKSFAGGIAFFMGYDDEVAPAKLVSKFAKDHEIVAVYGGILEGKLITADAVKNLASLPSKDELLAKLVGSINAPVSGFVNVLSGNLRGLVSVLNNIKEAKA